MSMSVEDLAKVLEEAYPEPVDSAEPCEHEEIEHAFKCQARHLLSKLDISPRQQPEMLEDVQAAAKRGFHS